VRDLDDAAHRIDGAEGVRDVREGEKWVSWAKKDSESVERIRADLMVPPRRNLSLTPGEDQEQFKKWLRDSGIPFKTRISLGQEYVVWAEEDTERVKKWPHWTEPPSEKSSRP